MAGKTTMKNRKDNKGRVLQKGESQRADNTYMYRWTDTLGKRQTIYAKTLNELREKELVVKIDDKNGLLYSKGNITGKELVERFLEEKVNLRVTTQENYSTKLKCFLNDSLSNVKIREIRLFMVKDFLKRLKNSGYSTAYVIQVKKILNTVFHMAVEEEVLMKNPFTFKLDFLEADSKEQRTALTEEQEKHFLSFVKEDKTFCYHYDMLVFLLHTGLRVGEICGLTLKDIDLTKRVITINKQLRNDSGQLKVSPPKKKAGYRSIYLDDEALRAITAIIKNSKAQKKDFIIDGYGGFVLYSKAGDLMYAELLSSTVSRIYSAYKKSFPEAPFICAHVLRHTFCSNMINKGINLKALQKIMGHSKLDVTLNVYAHKDNEGAIEDMKKVV